ncbi:MAG TPA: hypothetical protein VMF59_01815, partial [Bacteroidota bacterium]|nr:hypothetical protein [Bacteroidota bacterium]
LFHTDGYGARLYAYESGMPGLLSIPPLYGDGLRWYVRARWRPVEWAEIVIRYACTAKDPSVTETDPVRDLPFTSAAQIGLQADIRIP